VPSAPAPSARHGAARRAAREKTEGSAGRRALDGTEDAAWDCAAETADVLEAADPTEAKACAGPARRTDQ
jgi:hypothetical protein